MNGVELYLKHEKAKNKFKMIFNEDAENYHFANAAHIEMVSDYGRFFGDVKKSLEMVDLHLNIKNEFAQAGVNLDDHESSTNDFQCFTIKDWFHQIMEEDKMTIQEAIDKLKEEHECIVHKKRLLNEICKELNSQKVEYDVYNTRDNWTIRLRYKNGFAR